MRLTAQRRWLVPAAIAVGVAILLAIGISWEHNGRDRPRAREYTSKRACLLTDEGGVAVEPAATAWEGMQEASAATHAQVSFQSATGSTAAEALPYLNAMIEQGCGVIVTTGDSQGMAGQQAAGANPDVQFLLVLSSTVERANNVEVLRPGKNLRSQVTKSVQDLTAG